MVVLGERAVSDEQSTPVASVIRAVLTHLAPLLFAGIYVITHLEVHDANRVPRLPGRIAYVFFVYYSSLGDIRLWVGPRNQPCVYHLRKELQC